MKSTHKATEREYSYLIPRKKLSLPLPAKVGSFNLISLENKLISDLILERHELAFSKENIGVRIRKIDTKIEFTYKKFLGKENGLTRYDEVTEEVYQDTFDAYSSGNIVLFNDILRDLSKQGQIYPFLQINNSRKVAVYGNKVDRVEVVIEDLKYFSWEKNKYIKDAMIEIEIIKCNHSSSEIEKLVNYFCQTFDGSPTNEGKSTRASKFLGIESV